jgi:hypothetical protein
VRAELLEARGNLVRRLIGEREDADSVRVDSKVLDEESNAVDEAERLPRTRPGENEDGPDGSLDRLALRGRRGARRIRGDRPADGGDRLRYYEDRNRSGQAFPRLSVTQSHRLAVTYYRKIRLKSGNDFFKLIGVELRR